MGREDRPRKPEELPGREEDEEGARYESGGGRVSRTEEKVRAVGDEEEDDLDLSLEVEVEIDLEKEVG